ncbi:unnamed protein product [Dibothriocephalus latus]|uniref:Uncharacterized protein n=1 Tax=Dibothriocephalus latus TaxID=60516 RepID=A0A3P7L1B3_DIBLA|nr:unnamed protein product [Dibothriocephalus latus]
MQYGAKTQRLPEGSTQLLLIETFWIFNVNIFSNRTLNDSLSLLICLLHVGKTRNQEHPWIRRLKFDPELQGIEEVSEETEKEGEMAYHTESQDENDYEDEGRDWKSSCANQQAEGKEKKNGTVDDAEDGEKGDEFLAENLQFDGKF